MSSSNRMPPPTRKISTKPPQRPVPLRAQTATPTLNGRVSPADSLPASRAASRTRSPTLSPHGGTKRKARDYDHDAILQETNINVVVRCRGRSDREVKENSGVVVSANGVKGSTVELSMGPSALSNKTYNFDRVFSPAADQGMVFDEVVKPVLDQVISGFNCTIFAYGQTGTGKTYTMSGDITDLQPLPDEAGIIPRVLHNLFHKLEEEAESTVKCSFIELYNEELRDLLAADDAVKLKIFDDASRKSHGATLVQGMEETHIKSASKGLDLLRVGSHKRQVAATKCNDLSSRSHTVFTITTYIKRTGDNGEDVVTSGKLNLVDLAGSENIGRSGAENKRATEAGLINKSLLTLGRVINALVDKSSHIPYRESKLTRLLQDSLGGRTKTCIIATLSPAKSNLEETISTLDYAFRAKNIRNKPQANQLLSKKTLIREFTMEIEKLKSELIATRQRNGVYLTAVTYEEMTTESESRRILTEEQRDRIETMEANLRNKAHELFALTSNLNLLKRNHDSTRVALEGTQNSLEKTEVILEYTRQSLAQEEMLRKAHADSEHKLADIGQDLISTLDRTTMDINGLYAKHKRRSDLQALNRNNWLSAQDHVGQVTEDAEQKLASLQHSHSSLVSKLSRRVEAFVQDELGRLGDSMNFLHETSTAFENSEREVHQQTSHARDEVDCVLEGIRTLRGDLKQRVGQGLDGLSAAAKRISDGVIVELEGFHAQLHSSYSALGKDLKNAFDDVLRDLDSQQTEADRLRQQLSLASAALVKSNEEHSAHLKAFADEEKTRTANERAELLSQVSSLFQRCGEKQDQRLDDAVSKMQEQSAAATSVFETQRSDYDIGVGAWMSKGQDIRNSFQISREAIKQRIKSDWNAANEHTTGISDTTRSVHAETMRIVDGQMANMDEQLSALDDILARVRSQNSSHHDAHTQSLIHLGNTVKQSYSSIANHMKDSTNRTQAFSDDIGSHASEIEGALNCLGDQVRLPLTQLKSQFTTTNFTEYTATGMTPQKVSYSYPTALPRTQAHDKLVAHFRGQRLPESPRKSPRKRAPMNLLELKDSESLAPSAAMSPNKVAIFNDVFDPKSDLSDMVPSPHMRGDGSRPTSSASAPADRSLKETDINIAVIEQVSTLAPRSVPNQSNQEAPPSKRQDTGDKALSRSVGPGSKPLRKAITAVAEGRENVPLAVSTGRGRVLRARRS